MRARYPDREGLLVRDGAGIRYERYGDFGQNFHVRYRLDRYGAGQPVSYRDVETDGAARAAQLIAELI